VRSTQGNREVEESGQAKPARYLFGAVSATLIGYCHPINITAKATPMKKQIINVSVLQAAKVSAALYFVVSLVFIVIFAVVSTMFGMPMQMPMMFLLIAPVIYLVAGFIFTAIAALLYNLVASVVGGLEFTTKEVD
jgi:hypothetical protein